MEEASLHSRDCKASAIPTGADGAAAVSAAAAPAFSAMHALKMSKNERAQWRG